MVLHQEGDILPYTQSEHRGLFRIASLSYDYSPLEFSFSSLHSWGRLIGMEHLPTIGICGLGRVGAHFAHALIDKHLPLRVLVSSNIEHAAAIKGHIENMAITDSPAKALHHADLLFLTIPDRAIAPLVSTLAASDLKGKSIVHCSGALLADELRAAEEKAASIGVFHPLQAMPPRETRRERSPFDGIFIGVEASEPLRAILNAIAMRLGAQPFNLPEDAAARKRYHLAAVLASNALVALTDAGTEILKSCGISVEAQRLLLPLIQGTLRNLAGTDAGTALTGPAARGDANTLAAHLESLADEPELSELYVATMKHAARLATRAEQIQDKTLEELLKVLGEV